MNKTITTSLSATVLAALVLAGCGSDKADSSEKATTTARATTISASAADRAFCADAKAAFGGYQPGFDAIFEEHPEPTLEDWAAFLPAPTKEFDDVRTRLEALEASPVLADEFAAATDALDAVSANFHRAIDAAQAGDQAAYTAAEDQNQNTDLPAMGKATDALKAGCEAAS